MKERTLYVVPFLMGAQKNGVYAVEFTDQPYVAHTLANLYLQIGDIALEEATRSGISSFFPCVHCAGGGVEMNNAPWPCQPTDKTIIYLSENEAAEFAIEKKGVLYSFGSLYAGNSCLGQKWLGLRVLPPDAKFVAAHAAIISVQSLQSRAQKKVNLAVILPTGAGKTSLALGISKLAGWNVKCLGENLAFLFEGPNGSGLHAINPEQGFCGVAPGTNEFSHPSIVHAMRKGNVIYTNVAVTPEGEVWWEGKTQTPPENLVDWKGEKWTVNGGSPAAHPNSRFTFPLAQFDNLEQSGPQGVAISGIIFGCRRTADSLIPLVFQSNDWEHGLFYATTLSSETTSAQDGKVGVLERNPFGLGTDTPLVLHNYITKWQRIGSALRASVPGSPPIFITNLFRQPWPGYGHNVRILRWIVDRITHVGNPTSIQSPLGVHPPADENVLHGGIDLTGMELDKSQLHELLSFHADEWENEIKRTREWFSSVNTLPEFLLHQLNHQELAVLSHSSHLPTMNTKLINWVSEIEALTTPTKIVWCDGSKREYDELCNLLVEAGIFTRLNPKLRPNSFLARSSQDDVARVEERTFICSKNKDDAGPTNYWADPDEMKATLKEHFKGCMRGRTLYVIPFSMGPPGSPLAKYGVEITDSAYVVVNMHIMAHVGTKILQILGKDGDFVPCLHSVGYPLAPGQKDLTWPCSPTKYICHFPESREIQSFGSGYGGNALLGKKCLALRIASSIAREENWMAEHCLCLGITNPEGKTYYVAAGFPSQCGKTNMAMLIPTLPGWTVRTVGDDISWLKIGPDGRLYAINPETGFFGVAPGTNEFSNQSALITMQENTIFTNVALTDDGDVWWEEKTKTPPAHLIDWTGQDWTPDCGRKAAHPNSRYTTPAKQCPVIDPLWESLSGVPIDAIIFGGRRSALEPLIRESFSWEHGVFLGASCSSETTSAAAGAVGVVRRDPYAMLPFMGYNVGDYIQHWLDMGKLLGDKAPKIYYINVFRKSGGKYLWPGFGDNCRILSWIVSRVCGEANAEETPIGLTPSIDGINTIGLNVNEDIMKELLTVRKEEWIKELDSLREHFKKCGDRVPKEMFNQLELLEQKLNQ